MKRTTLIILFACATLAVSAQDFNKFHFGFKVSPNLSWMKPDDAKHMESLGSTLRLSYGLITDIHFTENYAFGTGLSIMTTGGNLDYFIYQKDGASFIEDGTQYVAKLERKYKLQYIEVPVTLKMKTDEIGYITYWGQFGLGLGVNINGKADDTYAFENESDLVPVPVEVGDLSGWKDSERGQLNEEEVSIKKDVQILRSSLIFGGGIEYSLSGNTSLLVGVLFNNGFSNSLKRQGVKAKDNGDPDLDGVTNILDLPTKEFDLKAVTKFIELQVGIMF